MDGETFFFAHIYRKMKSVMPDFVVSTFYKLLPIVFTISILEIFGLLVILPVIKVILEPPTIYNNNYLVNFYTLLDFTSEVHFVLALLFIVVLFFFFKYVAIYYLSDKQARLSYDVATKLTVQQFEGFLLRPYEFHAGNKTGDILRSIIEIPFNFANGILLPLVIILSEMLIVFLILSGIFLFNPFLFFSIICFVAPCLFAYTYIQKKRLKQVSVSRDRFHSEMFVRGRQGIEGFREIILLNKLHFFKPKFEKAVSSFSRTFSKIHLYNSISPKVIELIAVFCIFGIFISAFVMNYELKVVASFLIVFALAAYRLIPSINKLILSYNNIKSSDFVFDHFKEHAAILSRVKESKKSDTAALKFLQDIKLKDISFKYLNNEKNVLSQIDLTINKGETIGIIGGSGSGKTTLINILLMFLKPQNGQILIDGKKLTENKKRAWYKMISYVPQNVTLFPGTILENITYGIPEEEVNFDKVDEVIKLSQLGEFIDELKNGYYTKIGDHGLNISGGQRQRIGIARALYHGGSIIIFDEATSSLDRETESMITDAINELSKSNYSIIIITHRLETLKYCNKIYNIKKGLIKEAKYSNAI